MKHTEEYTWTYDRTNSKGEVLLRHDTDESLEDVIGYLEEQGIKYERKDAAHMLWIFYGTRAYMYYYTTGRWAPRNGWGKVPLKHYKSRGIKDFLDRFVLNEEDSNETTTDSKQEPNRLGDMAEHYAITWLWDQGYEVFKNCGCTGATDIVAIKDGEVTLIDVKTMHRKEPNKDRFSTSGRTQEQKDKGVVYLGYHPKTRKLRFMEHKK